MMSNDARLGRVWVVAAAALSMTCPVRATAIERFSSVGLSVGVPVQVSPTTRRDELSYDYELSYFLSEQWVMAMSLDFGLEKTNRATLAVGPQFFFLSNGTLLPYATARFLYPLQANHSLGWRVHVGVEWNLKFVTGMDNLRLCAESGLSELYPSDIPNPRFFDAFRLGLTWNY